MKRPNPYALQRTRPSHHCCNLRLSRAGSLSLSRWRYYVARAITAKPQYMKSRTILILLALFAFAQTAFSQSVRWRFTLPTPTYQKDVTHASIVANDGSGGAVFHVTDYRFYPPESGITGLQTVGNRIFWLHRTGTLLHTLTIEGAPVYPPSPILLTRSVLHIQLRNDTGAVTGFRRVAKTRNGVTVTDFAPPLDETVARGPTSLNTADTYGYFTFKKAGESVVQIVRYSP